MFLKSFLSRKGQAVVELTLGFLLFFFIVFSIVEFSHLLYTKLTLQHSFREAGRYMVTGQGFDPDDANARLIKIREVFCANLIATGLACPPLDQFTFTCFTDLGVETACAQPGGGSEQTVKASATFKKPALFPFFAKLFPAEGVEFQVSTTWKNEPFSNG